MPNHHEPPVHPHEPGTPHDPTPHNPDPHRDPIDLEHPETHSEELPEDVWGVEPLVTNSFNRGEHPALVRTRTDRAIKLPAVPNVTADPNVRQLKQEAGRSQELFESLKPTEKAVQQLWEQFKDSAYTFRSCLPDFLTDKTGVARDLLEKIEDKEGREAAKATFDGIFKNQEFLKNLREWEGKRRDFPWDFKTLAELQRQLTDYLVESLSELKNIESAGDKMAALSVAANSGQIFLSAVAFELGRQAQEVTTGAPVEIHYGSPSQAAAENLAINTSQNERVNRLNTGTNLAKMLSFPSTNRSDFLIGKYNKEVRDPAGEKLNEWRKAAGWGHDGWPDTNGWDGPKYDAAVKAAKAMRLETYIGQGKLNDFGLLEVQRNQLRDTLNLIIDSMVCRLTEMRERADLESQQKIDDELEEAKMFREREPTRAEKLAGEAVENGLSTFWSKKKREVFADIEKNVKDGKKLRDALDTAFQAGLSDTLDAWAGEMKKKPNKRNGKVLHDAALSLRLTARSYREAIKSLSKVPDYAERSAELLTSLDALQVAVSNEINQALLDGVYLF